MLRLRGRLTGFAAGAFGALVGRYGLDTVTGQPVRWGASWPLLVVSNMLVWTSPLIVATAAAAGATIPIIYLHLKPL